MSRRLRKRPEETVCPAGLFNVASRTRFRWSEASSVSKRIEDYALIGDRRSAALVARDGSIDWLCWPNFDSDACFAALLGDDRHGYWRLAPRDMPRRTTRRYRGDTLILETWHETAHGIVRVTDLMPIDTPHRAIIRTVRGEAGRVDMVLDLALRFDYGSIPPWLCAEPRVVWAIVGPDLAVLRSPIDLDLADRPAGGDRIGLQFTVDQGASLTFTLQYGASYEAEPEPLDVTAAIAATETFWRAFIGKFAAQTDWPGPVRRSLITLKALTVATTGAVIAAPTTSLPEVPGGAWNWDYRYSWLRDSTFALATFLNAGYRDEARAWRDWLLRAAAGVPERLRTMYRGDGGRNVVPHDVPWLPGYGGAAPVHVGNPAADQFQLDIYGEVLDSLHLCQQTGLGGGRWDIAVEHHLAAHIEKVWRQPDQGIWELRGEPRHYTFSKVMAWVGLDRYLKLDGVPAGRRRALESLRAEMHRVICRDGFSRARNSFVQSFGSDRLDASLLLLPTVGFLPIDDPRIAGTVAAVESELVQDGLVRRWSPVGGPEEGAFIACTCWLADCLGMQGRAAEARGYLERVIGLANDVGLLAEEWHIGTGRLTGNFPQALSHLSLVNTALGLCGPVLQRGGG
ncbi:MAG TPA: glycoside hydrolase family 15 protein [Stellaceae bacterium]|nr:glycoside hydrolase family 15 protein [Stellaceae bacterium]